MGGTQLTSQTRSGATSYFLQDGQGSTRALTNSTTGAVTDTYSYTAFGELFNQTGSTTNSYLYTGQQYDSLTGLYSLRARYYNPALGRFLSQDTYPYNFSNPVELNLYVYTTNSPINRMDPSGHFTSVEYAKTLDTDVKLGSTTVVGIGYKVGGVVALEEAFVAASPSLFSIFARIILATTLIVPEVCMAICPIFNNGQTPTQTQTQTQIKTQTDTEVLTQTQETDTEQGPTRRLYHATTVNNVLNILSGIDLNIGKSSPDFGQGFYTTASFADAVGIATKWKGGTGAIIVFDVPIAELNSLSHLVFTSPDSSWDNFILFNRDNQGLHHNYDWVEGPVAKSWDPATRTVVPWEYPRYHQLSIHTPAAAQLFQRSITKILDYGDPNVTP